MGFATLVYSVLVLWAIIHLIHRTAAHSGGHASSFILPTSSRARGSRRLGFSSMHLRVTLQPLYLRLETTGFNHLHDTLSSYVNKQAGRVLRKGLILVYDCGSMAGAIGMVIALGLLLVTAYKSSHVLLHRHYIFPSFDAAPVLSQYRKRDYSLPSLGDVKPDPPLQIILPGVTVPLSHLPLLLFALFFSQVVHELGHMVTAALESVPITSVGASLSIIIPSAFVVLPSAPMQALLPSSRLRIISAGSFHNVTLWLILRGSLWSTLGRYALPVVGYSDVGHYGKVVVAVDQFSPLRDFIPPKAIITALDDQLVGTADHSHDVWTTYLSRPKQDHHLGWCVNKIWFLDHPQHCCDHLHRAPENSVCFSAKDPSLATHALPRCVPALLVLQPNTTSPKRCTEATHCGPDHLCVKVEEDTELLRIQFRDIRLDHAAPEDAALKTVVWSGAAVELLSEVEVSDFLPRYGLLPVSLPARMIMLYSYISTLTLSLFFFNLLPLPYLDGSQFLEAIIDLVQGAHTVSSEAIVVDLESGFEERLARRSEHAPCVWRIRVRKGVQLFTTVLMATSLILSIIHEVQ